ncbi:MAG: hypothetical protein LBG22_01010 [Treponema sp.]|jgi:hypothetical protein|nr:hypothetical protein [Treponema sp.]
MVVIFEYRLTRGAKRLPFFLEGFVGYLQTDGYEVEREQRKKDMPVFRFLSGRWKAETPVLESFKKWLDAKVLEVPPSLLFVAKGLIPKNPLHRFAGEL